MVIKDWTILSQQLAVCFIWLHIYGSHHLPPEMDPAVLVPMMKWAFITGRKRKGVNKVLKINQGEQKIEKNKQKINLKNKFLFAAPHAFGTAFGFLISRVSVCLFPPTVIMEMSWPRWKTRAVWCVNENGIFQDTVDVTMVSVGKHLRCFVSTWVMTDYFFLISWFCSGEPVKAFQCPKHA